MKDGADLDRVCRALSDPTRRVLLRRLARDPGRTTAELAASVPRLTRWAVMKHLEVLREAGLLQTLPEARRRRHYTESRSLDLLDDWLAGLRGDIGSDETPR